MGCANHAQVTNVVYLMLLMVNLCVRTYYTSIILNIHSYTHTLLSLMLSADPEDYSSVVHYNVTFRQTVFTDGDVPASIAVSIPILIRIIDDGISEGVEYFQARIVGISDGCRVRIGQDTLSVTITDSSESFLRSGNNT